MIKSLIFSFTLVVFSTFSNLFAQGADAAVGDWLTPEKDSIIAVYKCGDKYCGKIACLKEPNGTDGQPKVDKENADEKLRTRPVLGLTIMTGFAAGSDGEYTDGKIYNSRDGKTYCGKMILEGNKLSLKGKICYTPFGKTNVWSKADSRAGLTCK